MASDARCRDTLKSLLAALGSLEPRRRQKARQTIRDTLVVNQKSWNDLLATLQFRGQHSDKLKKLFAMLGQDNDGEFANARQKISDLLARERRTWKSFVDSLFSTSSKAWSDWHDHRASNPAINPLDLVHHLLWRYLEMTPHQFVAASQFGASQGRQGYAIPWRPIPVLLHLCAGRGGRHRHAAAAGHAPLDRDPHGAPRRPAPIDTARHGGPRHQR